MSDHVARWLRQGPHASGRPVEQRVAELLDAVRVGAGRQPGESWDTANERYAEQFIAWLESEFPGRTFPVEGPDGATEAAARASLPRGDEPVVLVERQRLPLTARRTTGYNYAFTVPGDSPERVVLVAHYDTWRGPGADDNTTGEEIVKQYLVADLRAPRRPPLTRTYLLAGSEECGLIGFTSQLVLGLALGLTNVAWAYGYWAVMALGLVLVPLAFFRFGVSGSREYARRLSEAERRLVRAAISVDSVGEGRMYIPDTALGATFVRALVPLDGHERLNDLLQEAAHLHGIRYNTFLAGGTTDHISFLEEGMPAAALVAMSPGKASPLVLGGKIHTAADTADRVYPEPLGEALRILDSWFHVMDGGARIAEPRGLDEYHYARLYRVRLRDGPDGPLEEHWLALKDALEPNRRNVNGVYRVSVEMEDGFARCREPRLLGWGVETRLSCEVADLLDGRGRAVRVRVRAIEVAANHGTLTFVSRRDPVRRRVQAGAQHALGRLEHLMGTHSFLSFFGAAFLLARGVEAGLALAFRWPAFQHWFFGWFAFTLPATLILQIGAVVWLVGTRIPAMVDNSYKHLNKADNLGSLRRVSAREASAVRAVPAETSTVG